MKQTNLEYYKDEINKLIKECDSALISDKVSYAFKIFSDRNSKYYPGRSDKFVDWLLSDHNYKIKLTKFEFDLMMTQPCRGIRFKQLGTLMDMKLLGYYKDIKDTSMFIDQIIENCEVQG